jgi:hypothetical protein
MNLIHPEGRLSDTPAPCHDSVSQNEHRSLYDKWLRQSHRCGRFVRATWPTWDEHVSQSESISLIDNGLRHFRLAVPGLAGTCTTDPEGFAVSFDSTIRARLGDRALSIDPENLSDTGEKTGRGDLRHFRNDHDRNGFARCVIFECRSEGNRYIRYPDQAGLCDEADRRDRAGIRKKNVKPWM